MQDAQIVAKTSSDSKDYASLITQLILCQAYTLGLMDNPDDLTIMFPALDVVAGILQERRVGKWGPIRRRYHHAN